MKLSRRDMALKYKPMPPYMNAGACRVLVNNAVCRIDVAKKYQANAPPDAALHAPTIL